MEWKNLLGTDDINVDRPKHLSATYVPLELQAVRILHEKQMAQGDG